jgi:hypothetical protein
MAPPRSNGSILGHVPSNPGQQSSIITACMFDSRTATSQVSASFTLHDFPNAVWHNGSVRRVNVTAVAGNVLTVTGCRGINLGGEPSDYVNSVVTGSSTAIRRHIDSITGCGAADTGSITMNAAPGTVPGVIEIENSKARTAADATTSGSTVTSTNATFNAATDIGCSISGTNFAAGSTITAVAGNTATVSPAPVSSAAAQVITICGTDETATTRMITNVATSIGGTTLTNSGATNTSVNRFEPTDIGLEVSDGAAGTAITEPCYIVAISGGADPGISATVNNGAGAACTIGDGLGKTLAIGRPSPTSPDGEPETDDSPPSDQLAHLNVQLDLNPTLVAGQDACTNDTPEGFAIAGTYRNPSFDVPGAPAGSNFIGGVFATQPANSKAVGQIVFDTSVVDFAAYVLERRGPPGTIAGTPIEPQAAKHYDIHVPNAPTGLALCSSATSPGLALFLTVDASTSSITSLPTGFGRPGTAQVRHLRPSTAATAGFMFLRSDAGPTWTGSNYARLCSVPAPPFEVDFRCGP